jgi:hypothetical protein
MSSYNFDSTPTFFGLTIPTHRTLLLNNMTTMIDTSYGVNSTIDSSGNLDTILDPYFPYEPLIAAISIIFFRMTVKLHSNEPIILRWLFCIVLGILAYTKQSYQLITAVELFSYTISYLLLLSIQQQQQQQQHYVTSSSPHNTTKSSNTRTQQLMYIMQRLLLIVFSAISSMLISHVIFTSTTTNIFLIQFLYKYMIPSYIVQLFLYLFPIVEIYKAYTIMYQLSFEKIFFQSMIYHLFFVTFHIQVGMGFLGIAFLRAEQSRRNQLIRLDVYENEVDENNNHANTTTTANQNHNDNTNHGNGTIQKTTNSRETQMSEKSKLFQRGAAPFSTFRSLCLSFVFI